MLVRVAASSSRFSPQHLPSSPRHTAAAAGLSSTSLGAQGPPRPLQPADRGGGPRKEARRDPSPLSSAVSFSGSGGKSGVHTSKQSTATPMEQEVAFWERAAPGGAERLEFGGGGEAQPQQQPQPQPQQLAQPEAGAGGCDAQGLSATAVPVFVMLPLDTVGAGRGGGAAEAGRVA